MSNNHLCTGRDVAYRSSDFPDHPAKHNTHRYAVCGDGVEAYVAVADGADGGNGDEAIVSFSGGQGFQVQARERDSGDLDAIDVTVVGGGIEIPDFADALEWAAQELRRQHAEAMRQTRAHHTD